MIHFLMGSANLNFFEKKFRFEKMREKLRAAGDEIFSRSPVGIGTAVSACMPRFEAVLADAEVRRPRVACDPRMKDGSKQLSRKSSAIRLQPDRGPRCLSEHNAPSIVPTLFSVRTEFLKKAGRAPVKPGEVGKRALFARF